MPLVVLSQQVLAVVVAIRRADDGVDVLDVRNARGHQVAKRDRLLMIELDEDDRAVDAVIEHAAGLGVADPGQPRAVQKSSHLVHLHPRMPVVHVVDVESDQLEQLPALSVGELVRANAGVVQDDVVSPGFGQDVIAGLREPENRLLALLVGQRIDQRQPAILFVLEDRGALVLPGCARRQALTR